jgi:hypothetical protein
MNYDRSKLHLQCSKYKIEHGEMRNENKIIFICPEMPDNKIKIELVSMIPKEASHLFIVGPKISTTETLVLMLKTLNIQPLDLMVFLSILSEKAAKGDRHLLINLNVQIPDDNPLWNEIGEVIARDGFYKTWTITLGDKTITEKIMKVAAEMSEHHNIRDHAILNEDMTNLKISLGKDQDVLDFLKEIN